MAQFRVGHRAEGWEWAAIITDKLLGPFQEKKKDWRPAPKPTHTFKNMFSLIDEELCSIQAQLTDHKG